MMQFQSILGELQNYFAISHTEDPVVDWEWIETTCVITALEDFLKVQNARTYRVKSVLENKLILIE